MRQSSFQRIIFISLKSRISQLHHSLGKKHHGIIYKSSSSQMKTVPYIRQLNKIRIDNLSHGYINLQTISGLYGTVESQKLPLFIEWSGWTMVILLLNLWHIWVHSRLTLSLHFHPCWEWYLPWISQVSWDCMSAGFEPIFNISKTFCTVWCDNSVTVQERNSS